MPITESRLRAGTLTLDAQSFATQATNVRIESSSDEVGDPLEVLSGDKITADEDYSFSLVIEAVQDFDDPVGFQMFALTNRGEQVPYSWKPNADSPTFTGTCRIRPPSVIGGEVNARLTADYEFPCTDAPTVTPDA